MLFSEATSALEGLTKSHTLLQDISQWHNSHHLKLNVQKMQFCIFSNRNLKDYCHLNFLKTQTLNRSSHSMSQGLLFTWTSHFLPTLLILQLEHKNLSILFIKVKNIAGESLKTYKIIVCPILEYCSAIYQFTTQKVTKQ